MMSCISVEGLGLFVGFLCRTVTVVSGAPRSDWGGTFRRLASRSDERLLQAWSAFLTFGLGLGAVTVSFMS
jgi:hypothetical protein